MPRLKQRNLAKITLENPHLIKEGHKNELVAMGGYSKSVQHTPGKVLESKGYLEALAEFGLTDELLTTSLVADIIAKPANRKPELELGFKVRGALDSKEFDTTKSPTIIIPIQVSQSFNINGTDSKTIGDDIKQEPV